MGWASRVAKSAGLSRRGAAVPSDAARFIPVRVVAPSRADRGDGSPRLEAEVILTSGRRVRLSGDLSIPQLGQLLDALEGRHSC